jgi:hypothetical protein
VFHQQKKLAVQNKKELDKQEEPILAMTAMNPRYRSLTCYNCGEPSHFVGICSKPNVSSICAILSHYMTDCPSWKKPQPMVTYIGSAGPGLGFYHIDLPQKETTGWLNISNCTVVEIRKGDILLQELERSCQRSSTKTGHGKFVS